MAPRQHQEPPPPHQQHLSTTESETVTVAPSKKQKCAVKTNPLAMWACDICQLFQSPDYDEVLEHEKKCGKGDHTADKEREDDSNGEEDEYSNENEDEEKESTEDEKPAGERKSDESNASSNKGAESPSSRKKSLNKSPNSSKSEEAKCFSSISEPTKPNNAKEKPWTTHEHNRCLDSIVKHGPNWDIISTFVKTRSTQQVKDYALRHFSHLLRPSEPIKTNLKRTKWRCDVCQMAMFEDYDEAVEHESHCRGGDEGTENDRGSGESVKKKKARQNSEWKPQQMIAEYTTNGSTVTERKDDINEVNCIPMNPIPDALASRQGTVENFSSVKVKSNTNGATSVGKNAMTVSATLMQPTLTSSLTREYKTKPESLKSKTEFVDFLAAKTSEKIPKRKLSNISAKDRNCRAADSGSVEDIAMPSKPENLDQHVNDEQVALNDLALQAKEYSSSTVSVLLGLGIPAASIGFVVKYLSRHLFDNIIDAPLVPTMAFIMVSLVVLIMVAYSSFALALVVTHGGSHHHRTQGAFMDILRAIRDTVQASVDMDSVNLGQTEGAPVPTLREYLNHPDGFHMAFAPAFFGFFAYFGALTALEEETNGLIVPSVTRKNGDNDSPVPACGLKSVAGASAGAMAAVMLAAGIQPRKAAEFACTFNWSMVADPPGFGGFVKGDKFEEFMRSFIRETAATRNGCEIAKDKDSVMMEDALVPVAVSGFDLLRMKGVLVSRGCMAKAARSSAGFPGLFQPVSWRKERAGEKRLKRFPDMLLIDGGIRDSLGLNGLSAFPSNSARGKRVMNIAVGDFGFNGPRGMKDLPRDVDAESLVSIAIVNTPMCGPWAMENGPKAVEAARKAMLAMMDVPLERGTSRNHYILRVDASRFL
ncbi:hypothetical protein HJC23_000941 [Cyclotella cryptica]